MLLPTALAVLRPASPRSGPVRMFEHNRRRDEYRQYPRGPERGAAPSGFGVYGPGPVNPQGNRYDRAPAPNVGEYANNNNNMPGSYGGPGGLDGGRTGPPLAGAAARWAARSAAQAAAEAAAAAEAEAAAADAEWGEEEVGFGAGPSDPSAPKKAPRPRKPRSPKEAMEGLQRMGARVIQPPAHGAAMSPEASWDSLAGAQEVRLQVEEVLVLPLMHPDAFASVRAATREYETDRAAALLFYGPPGTGKTTAAKIAAAQAGLPLVYAPLEVLMSKWFGQAEQQLAKLFDYCEALGRCVVFLDELDALAGSRSREIDDASRRMLSVLLRRLDGMEAQPDTTLIGATNRRTDLDAALLSRFDVRVHFPAPDSAGRAEIFGLYAKHLPAEDRARLGEASQGLTGRDVLDVCRQAERRWVVKLLKGEVTHPPLPPLSQYEVTLRHRLDSSSDVQDDDVAAKREAEARAQDAASKWRGARRPTGNVGSVTSLGPNSVGSSWAHRPFNEGSSRYNGIRPPGW